MNKISLFFVLISFVIQLHSQNYFISEISDSDLHIALNDLIENDNNYGFIAGGFKGLHDDSLGAYIIVLDEIGKVIKDNARYKSDSSWVYRALYKTSDTIFALSTIKEKGYENENTTYFIVSKFDENLNLFSEKKYIFPFDTLITNYVFFKKFKENILTFGYCWNNVYTRSYSFLGKITQDTTLFKIIEEPINDIQILGSNIYQIGYIDTSYYLPGDCMQRINYNTLEVDSTYLFCNGTDSDIDISIRSFLKPYSDSSFLFFYSQNKEDAFFNNSLMLIDTNFIIIKDTCLNEAPNLGNVTTRGLDFKYKNHIYLLNFNGGFQITKIDSSFNVQWTKMVSLPYDYWTISVTATSDSGALVNTIFNDGLIGTRLIKFDKKGNYEPTSIPEGVKISDYALYPNPASDILKVQKAVQVKEAEIVLYNSVGQTVLRKRLTASTTEIDISALPSGVYIYNIFRDGKKDDDGKVIIE